jgi:ABC-2 type transport system ATP-binding protein
MAAPVRLSLDSVTVRYGGTRAVDRLSLQAFRGEVVALIGPNGSGKSTTLAVAAGLLQPAEGSVWLDDISPATHRTEFSRKIGFVAQEVALYEELSLVDNLAFFGNLYGLHGPILRRRIDNSLELAGLSHRAASRVGQLSGGMQRRAHLACALVHEPAVLLLDEPTAALDPESRQNLYETLIALRSRGCVILLTTHHIDEVEDWCDRVVVLSHGRLIASGTPREIAGRTRRHDLLGSFAETLTEELEGAIRRRLPRGVEIDVEDRQFYLHAEDGESLAFALEVLHAEGAEPVSYRTPPTEFSRLFEAEPDSSRAIAVPQRRAA